MKIKDVIVEQNSQPTTWSGGFKDELKRRLMWPGGYDPRERYQTKSQTRVSEPSAQGQQSAQVQQPVSAAQTTAPVQQGYRTAVIVPTAAGDRRFWYDGKNWREHFGQDWPRDLQTSQVVSDPNTVQFLAKQVQLKNTQQIPYGQRPKNKKKS